MTYGSTPPGSRSGHLASRVEAPPASSRFSPASGAQSSEGPLKPRLRGVLHVLAAVVSVPATALLVRSALPGVATQMALAYGVALFLVFGTSGLYHTPVWSLRARRRMRRLDHSMIYVMIAGSYVPFAYHLDALPRGVVMAVTLGGGLLGFIKAHAWERAPRLLTTGYYVLIGWCIVPFLPALHEEVGTRPVALLLLGGVCYTLGALIYWRRRPNPWPRTFGHHELNHLVGLGGAAAHYVAIWGLLT